MVRFQDFFLCQKEKALLTLRTSVPCHYRPYSHKLLTINNYVNCPSNFAYARLIYLFHPPIFEKILMRIRSIDIALQSILHSRQISRPKYLVIWYSNNVLTMVSKTCDFMNMRMQQKFGKFDFDDLFNHQLAKRNSLPNVQVIQYLTRL